VEKNGGEHHSAPFLQLQAASADVAYIHYDFRTNRPKELGSSRITLVTRPGVRESARGKMDGTTRLVKPSTTTVTSTHLSKATKCSPKIGQHPGHLPVKGHAGTNLRRGSPKADQATAATEKKNIRDFIHTKRMEKESEKLKQYPVLSSNLSQPGLYEDGWLSHQEAALTEVVNAIFRAVDDGDRTSKQPLLEELVELYNQPEVTALHRRLQASLDYGALAPPKDALRMPATDIGLRKRLAGLWLENYDTEALRAAVQVISGRQLPPVNSSPQTLDPHAGQRNLAAFLEMFFISMADVDHTSSGALSDDAIALRFKKMMARNLMMIWLLDQAKTNGALGEGRRLFKSTSTKKSSQAVLHGLMSLLLPFIGDPMRSLKHMVR
jgi:abnormal spindle-like microcephaly-associated protein